jgi:hypothetical protein
VLPRLSYIRFTTTIGTRADITDERTVVATTVAITVATTLATTVATTLLAKVSAAFGNQSLKKCKV